MKKIIYLLLLLVVFVTLQVYSNNFYGEETIVVLLYLIITGFSISFKPDITNIFVPQNIAFIVFFARLYLIPCLAMFFGYNTLIGTSDYEISWIFKGYMISLVMYLAFIVGWDIKYVKMKDSIANDEIISESELNRKSIRIVSITFLVFGLISLILFFQDLDSYLLNIFSSHSQDIIEKEDSKLISLFANLAKFFLPISIFGFISLIDLENKSKLNQYILLIVFLIITIVFTLNTNRQSMVYPILALFAGFARHVKFKALPVIFVGIFALSYLFAFQNIRSSESFDFTDSMEETEDLISDIQVYAGGAHMIAPIFKSNDIKHTIFYSFFESVPILGKPLREKSGVEYYNKLFYDGADWRDQVFLTPAECYVNGRYPLVILFFLLIGYFYSYLNMKFIHTENSQFLYHATLFYFILLFNSSILLSFQVMGQFLFYNSLPALIILYMYNKATKTTNEQYSDS